MKPDPAHAPCNLRRFPLPVAKLQPILVPLPSWRWALRWLALAVIAFLGFGLATIALLKFAET